MYLSKKKKLKQEIHFIKKISLNIGYPEDIMHKHISKNIAQFSTARKFEVWTKKVSSVLSSPVDIGSASQLLQHQIKSAVQNCYDAVSPRLIFLSQCTLSPAKKNVLPANQRSMVIYEYVCHFNSRYVGRTAQRLQERIKQHVSKAIRQRTSSTQYQGTH